jgi:cbb3-type cytochrome oxidase subunit 3
VTDLLGTIALFIILAAGYLLIAWRQKRKGNPWIK